jgi:hypothetical protein
MREEAEPTGPRDSEPVVNVEVYDFFASPKLGAIP